MRDYDDSNGLVSKAVCLTGMIKARWFRGTNNIYNVFYDLKVTKSLSKYCK